MKTTSSALLFRIVIGICISAASVVADEPSPTQAPASIFSMPRQWAGLQRANATLAKLVGEKRYADAEKLLAELTTTQPPLAVNFYNLACMQAIQGKVDAAFESLERAAKLGLPNRQLVENDPDLANLRNDERFESLVDRLGNQESAIRQATVLKPRVIADGVALVGVDNTTWDAASGLLLASFQIADEDPRQSEPAVAGHGEVGETIRHWQREGTATGLLGVLYDNRDRDHSNLSMRQFPQLTAVEYADEAKREGIDYGLQSRLLFNLPTIGNSSTALTAGPLWRSQTRMVLFDPQSVATQFRHYVSNHLYFYPEHRDYDPGHNGQGGGYGDVFPFNTPFVITSQGSSGSDRPFMDAVACTLAAFRPDTRAKLVDSGFLAPTVQMIFRMSNKQVTKPEDYLAGKAHPPVFSGEQLDVDKMVRMAHEMQPVSIPPFVQLRVVEEDQARPGVDFFDLSSSERIFDAPVAIARVFRTVAKSRRMLISAAASREVNDRPLTFHWKVLQGREDLVTIKPTSPDGTVAELIVSWHERMAVAGNDAMQTNRVDIGVFAHNGEYYSAPAFVTHYCADSEQRQYNDRGQVVRVQYRSQANGGNYVDPTIYTARDWIDSYNYDPQGRQTGWTRSGGDQQQEFTTDGHLIEEFDERGRASKVRAVGYTATATTRSAPTLEYGPIGETLSIEYAGDDDGIGKLKPSPP